MSFQLFIYYCALCGGWAAFITWALVGLTRVHTLNVFLQAGLIGGLLGMFVAAAVGFVDAVLNSVGKERLVRVALCAMMGLIGGAVGGLIGQVLNSFVGLPTFLGWIVAGVLIGASLGTYDVLQAVRTSGDRRASMKKMLNGVYGGLLGGLIGGLPYTFLQDSTALPRSGSTIGLVILGVCIGLMIGLAQVILKEAWIKVEEGFRAGRQVLLTKDEITIGRAESCDLGLFGDNSIEKVHARILLQKNRYLLAHAGESGVTYLNDQPVGTKPMPLKAGDLIQVGKCVLSFGERQKRRK